MRASAAHDGRRRGDLAGTRLLAYTDASTYGGAEKMLGTLLAHLDPGIEVAVAGTCGDVVESLAAARPGTSALVIPASGGGRAHGPGRILQHATAHRRILRRQRPEILQVNLRTPYSCVSGLVAGVSTPNLRTIAVEHLPLASTSRSRRLLKRRLSRRLDAHVAVSNATARTVEDDARLPAGSIRTIHNGVDCVAPPSARSPSSEPLLGAIGRLDHQKGLDVLLEALVELPHVSALIVGEGPQRARLLEQARRLRLSRRVTFTGWVPDVLPYLGSIHALVLPSRYEGLPLAVLEAMHAGVPVVASEVGGVRECLEDGETGLLVPAEDSHALAEALRALLASPRLQRRLAERAQLVARRRFSVSAMVRSFERLYLEVLMR